MTAMHFYHCEGDVVMRLTLSGGCFDSMVGNAMPNELVLPAANADLIQFNFCLMNSCV